MKKLRLLMTILFLAVVMTAVSGVGIKAQAADKTIIRSMQEISVGGIGTDNAIWVILPEIGDHIENLKTGSSKLYAKITKESVSADTSMPKETFSNEVNIGLYAYEEGKYTVSFNVVDKNGTVKEKKSVTINAAGEKENPIKQLFADGVNVYSKSFDWYGFFETHATPTIKVVLNDGYTLKKLEYAVPEKKEDETGWTAGDFNYKTIKNGEKISFGKLPASGEYYSEDRTENPFMEGEDSCVSVDESSYGNTFSNVFTFAYIKVTYTKSGSKKQYTYVQELMKYMPESKVSSKISSVKAGKSDATYKTKVRINVNEPVYEGVLVTFDAADYRIGDLKTSSKKLGAAVAFTYSSHAAGYTLKNGELDTERYNYNWGFTSCSIMLFAKEEGTYTLTFNIYDKDGNLKAKNCKVKVYAYADKAIKSITFAGKNVDSKSFSNVIAEDVAKGKFKVTMNEGNELLKLEYSYCREIDESDELETLKSVEKTLKVFNNGKSIPLNSLPDSSETIIEYTYDDSQYYYDWYTPEEIAEMNLEQYEYIYRYKSTSLYAETRIVITYIDKYTKLETEKTYYLYKLLLDR